MSKEIPLDFTRALSAERAALSNARRARLESAGWTVHRHKLPVDLRWHSYAPYLKPSTSLDEPEQETAAVVFDHVYRLVHESGLEIHVGEPYPMSWSKVTAEQIKSLCGRTYRLVVADNLEMHNPGDTVAVWVYRLNEAKRIERLLPKGGRS